MCPHTSTCLGSEAAIFNTLVFIDLNGNIVGRHRKTTPSYTERMWWSFGDGSDLVVVDMPEVGRVCGLLCWEVSASEQVVGRCPGDEKGTSLTPTLPHLCCGK